ncbi:hypothetical protein SLEP1_g53124 [Rubroshorea leprosula]|uniref:Uncharacterized protein n=1 Tax=Rubroshorea leprosula TaxID=152421 RepID=A0AAV5M8F9_9ROSI|nr:hypothetical protein SLEP1_g53124 [Rubroshorea leprosula]
MHYLWIIIFPYVQLFARQEPVLDSSKYTAADVRIMSSVFLSFNFTEGKL